MPSLYLCHPWESRQETPRQTLPATGHQAMDADVVEPTGWEEAGRQGCTVATSQQGLGTALGASVTSTPYEPLPRNSQGQNLLTHPPLLRDVGLYPLPCNSFYSLFIHLSSRKVAPFMTV